MAEVIEIYQGIPSDWVYHRGDIYIANLNPYTGAEQGGIRPVVVLQNNIGNLHSPTLIVAAMMLFTALAACTEKTNEQSSAADQTSSVAGNSETTEESYDGKLVLDHSLELKYAKCFSVDYYKGGYKIAQKIFKFN